MTSAPQGYHTQLLYECWKSRLWFSCLCRRPRPFINQDPRPQLHHRKILLGYSETWCKVEVQTSQECVPFNCAVLRLHSCHSVLRWLLCSLVWEARGYVTA